MSRFNSVAADCSSRPVPRVVTLSGVKERCWPARNQAWSAVCALQADPVVIAATISIPAKKSIFLVFVNTPGIASPPPSTFYHSAALVS